MSRLPYRAPHPPDDHVEVVVEASRGGGVWLVVPVAWLLAGALVLEVRSLVGMVLAALIVSASYVVGHRPARRWLVVSPDELSLYAGRALWPARRLGGFPIDGELEVSVRPAPEDDTDRVGEVTVVGAAGHLTVRLAERDRAHQVSDAIRDALVQCGAILATGTTSRGRVVERSSRDTLHLSWRSRPHSFAREEARRALRGAVAVLGVALASVILLRMVGVLGGVLVLGWGAYNLGALRGFLRQVSGATRIRLDREHWRIERSRFGWVRSVSGLRPLDVTLDPAGGVLIEADGRTVRLGEDLTVAEARWVVERLAAPRLQP